MPKKYRVWCKKNNEWEKDAVFLAPDGNLFHITRRGNLMRCREGTHVVQFFTGVMDKNGKPIYEGDIYRNPYGTIGIVEFDTEQAVFAVKGFVMINKNGAMKGEVIGNIHQNPELLETEDRK
jgi:hypothetical protein